MKYYEQKNKFKYGVIGILIALPFILTSFMLKSESDINDEINSNFTINALVDEIKCHNFKYPDIILAQAVLETSHFKSAVFKENNNNFGMRFPRRRPTLAKGLNLNHAVYSNWKESVEDRLIYENLYLNGFSRVKYKSYLNRVYAKDKNYTKKLEKLIIQNKLNEYFDCD